MPSHLNYVRPNTKICGGSLSSSLDIGHGLLTLNGMAGDVQSIVKSTQCHHNIFNEHIYDFMYAKYAHGRQKKCLLFVHSVRAAKSFKCFYTRVIMA